MTERPRIVHLVDSYLPTSQTFVYAQLVAQQHLVEQSIVTRAVENVEQFPWPDLVVAGSPSPTHTWLRGTPRRVVRKLARREQRIQARTESAAAARLPDVLHAHFGWTGRRAAAISHRLRIPLLTALHGADVYIPDGPGGDGRRYYAELWATGAAFTCVGSRAKDHLVGLGCPPDRLHVVPVGVDMSSFAFEPRDVDPQRPHFLQVARLVDKKGIDVTISAFRDVLDEIPGARLSIAGDGPLRAELESCARRLGVADAVTFHGSLDASSVRRLMADADVGVQPSRIAADGDSEGSPTVLIEFQARGLDVASTVHADIPEIVRYPEDLVPEDDARALGRRLLTAVRRSTPARAERLRAARDFVMSRHDTSIIALQLRQLYGELAAERRSS